MEIEEIVKKEYLDVISEIKANQYLHNEVADASILEMANEMHETAKWLLYLSPEEVFLKIKKDLQIVCF